MEKNNLNNVTDLENLQEATRNNIRKRNHKQRPSIFFSIILILVGAIITSIIFFLCFKDKILTNTNEEPIENIQPNEEITEEKNEQKEVKNPNIDLNIDGEFVQNLYKKVPINLFAQVIYTYNLTTQADLTQRQKMLFVLLNMRENKEYTQISSTGIIDRLESNKIYTTSGDIIATLEKYTIEDIEKNYKYVFGNDREIDKVDYETNLGFIFEYDLQDDCFYGHSYAGGGGTSMVYQTILDSADKNDSNTEIYLYDYYIKSEPVPGEGYNIYTYSIGGNKIGNEWDVPTYYDENTNKTYINDSIIEKYKKNGLVKFKHTFKLDDTGNFYWYSCEPID